MRILDGWQLWIEDVSHGTHPTAEAAQDYCDTVFTKDFHQLESVKIEAIFLEDDTYEADRPEEEDH